MNKVILKPTRSKILLFWALFSAVNITFVFIFSWNEISDLGSYSWIFLITVFQSFVFTIILYNLPFFRVEINEINVVGPRGYGFSWQRIEIPIIDVDLQNIEKRGYWFGFYAIKSKSGGTLSLWGFDEEQFDKFVDLVTDRKAILK